jgi:hypothetical protein
MKRLKTWLLNKSLKMLYNTVSEDDILRMRGTKLYIGDKMLTDGDRRSIKSGAVSIQSLETWKLLVKEMKYMSNKQMYENSSTVDDMIFGKAMLYTIDMMEKKIRNLSKLK